MDLNSSYQQLHQNQPNSRLLRFRSSTSSDIRSNFKQSEGNNGANHEPERLVFRFNNSGDTSSTFREFMEDKIDNNNNDFQQSSSMGMDQDQPNDFINTHLLRQNSSTPSYFSNIISFRNGIETMKGEENYNEVNDSDGELTLSMNISKNQIGFLPRSPSFLEMLSQNSKMESDDIGTTSRDDGTHNSRYYGHKFVYDSNDQFLDSVVPSGTRAKRGFATHPRSVAERVRRTRISERIRKLQEIVPNIDKQTCTSEMLDLAVDYIKDLQKQLKTMGEKRAKCICKNQK